MAEPFLKVLIEFSNSETMASGMRTKHGLSINLLLNHFAVKQLPRTKISKVSEFTMGF